MKSEDRSEKIVLEIFEKIRVAMLENDASILEKYVAEDYRGSDAGGTPHGKAEMLKAYGPGGIHLKKFEVYELYTMSWSDTVLVNGTGIINGFYENQHFEHNFRFLDVYAKRSLKWELISSHITDIQPF